ncbi:MAG: YceI family protein [Gemmatimonadota bacterium]
MTTIAAALVIAALAAAPDPSPSLQVPVAPITWTIDPVHSEVSFRIRHFVTRVRGTFRKWNGTITADPANLAAGSVNVTIEAASIFTDNERRDTHLRSADFFDVANHPTITFTSTRVEATGNRIRVTGDLTIRGVTKSVVLEGEFLGVSGPDGKGQRIGFQASTVIDRKDFGVSWNRAAEGGGLMLGDDVTIDINIEAVRQ